MRCAYSMVTVAPAARSNELPACLTELLTPGEAKRCGGGDAVDRGFAAANRVGETKPRALWGGHVCTVFRLVGTGDLFEFCSVADRRGAPFDDHIEILVECVAAGCESAMLILFEVLRLALVRPGAEVHRITAPDSQ